MSTDTKIETARRVGAVTPLFGVLTRAGSIIVNEEADCAVIVSMTREELQAVKYLPMYHRVAVVRADELERLDRYCSALEEQLDSIGLQKAQHVAGLSSPNAGHMARAGNGAAPKE